jgi:hypothetical protein
VTSPILGRADYFDLELLESRMLDGHTQEFMYRPLPSDGILSSGRSRPGVPAWSESA